MCAIRLHNVCNRVTQREQLDYTRCVIELPNVKKDITGAGKQMMINKTTRIR